MALKPGLRVSQTQRLALTPELRQSLAILQMSALDLERLIASELEENPLLITESSPSQGTPGDYQYALDTVAHEKTLGEYLCDQISLMRAPEKVREIAFLLASDLTPEGYLPDTISSLAEVLGTSTDLILRATALLQKCDPVGIGALDLRNCLDIQLVTLGEAADRRKIITQNLSAFASGDIDRLSKTSDLPKPEITRLAAILSSLDPYPASSFTQTTAQALHPDVSVSLKPETGLEVDLIYSATSSLTVNAELHQTARKNGPVAAQYVREQTQRANTLIRSIEARSKTILRVSAALVSFQHQFFTKGSDHLLPLTQADLAQTMGLHPSTLTRAIAGKSLICQFGVFPLKFFFSRAVNSNTESDARSVYVVQQAIRRMINTESPDQILSDALITSQLQKSGVDISRRTVAKYRQCLKIPTSAQRRRSKRNL